MNAEILWSPAPAKNSLHFRWLAGRYFAIAAVFQVILSCPLVIKAALLILFHHRVLQIVRRLMSAQIASLGSLEFPVQTGNQIDELLRLYLRYHFEGLKPLRSTEIFNHNKAVTN